MNLPTLKPIETAPGVPTLGHAQGLPDLPPGAEVVDDKGNKLSLGVDDKTLPPSRMLLEGTPDEATENEYAVALGAKIVQHACRMMPMKMKIQGGGYKKVPALVLNEHALAHVLKVFFAGGEITDETLAWNPQVDVSADGKVTLPEVTA